METDDKYDYSQDQIDICPFNFSDVLFIVNNRGQAGWQFSGIDSHEGSGKVSLKYRKLKVEEQRLNVSDFIYKGENPFFAIDPIKAKFISDILLMPIVQGKEQTYNIHKLMFLATQEARNEEEEAFPFIAACLAIKALYPIIEQLDKAVDEALVMVNKVDPEETT